MQNQFDYQPPIKVNKEIDKRVTDFLIEPIEVSEKLCFQSSNSEQIPGKKYASYFHN